MAWTDILQRVFEVDALHCPQCGGRMRILSAITDPHVARRILECLDIPSRAPPLGKPKGGPAELPREEPPESVRRVGSGSSASSEIRELRLEIA